MGLHCLFGHASLTLMAFSVLDLSPAFYRDLGGWVYCVGLHCLFGHASLTLMAFSVLDLCTCIL